MPRRKRGRWMWEPPLVRGFKPFGIPFMNSEPVVLLLEEYEAIKLADYENLTHDQACTRMGVSRPTFTRIYDAARKKIAKAFVEGIPIVVHGGNVEFKEKWYRCLDCNRIFKFNEILQSKINNKEGNVNKNSFDEDQKMNKNIEQQKNDDKNNDNKSNKINNFEIKCPFCGSSNVIEIEELHRRSFNRGRWF